MSHFRSLRLVLSRSRHLTDSPVLALGDAMGVKDKEGPDDSAQPKRQESQRTTRHLPAHALSLCPYIPSPIIFLAHIVLALPCLSFPFKHFLLISSFCWRLCFPVRALGSVANHFHFFPFHDPAFSAPQFSHGGVVPFISFHFLYIVLLLRPIPIVRPAAHRRPPRCPRPCAPPALFSQDHCSGSTCVYNFVRAEGFKTSAGRRPTSLPIVSHSAEDALCSALP